jgi:hypothetical protein
VLRQTELLDPELLSASFMAVISDRSNYAGSVAARTS